MAPAGQQGESSPFSLGAPQDQISMVQNPPRPREVGRMCLISLPGAAGRPMEPDPSCFEPSPKMQPLESLGVPEALPSEALNPEQP